MRNRSTACCAAKLWNADPPTLLPMNLHLAYAMAYALELPGDEAILRPDKSGRLVLDPLPRRKLPELLSTWTPLDEKDRLPAIEDAPPEAVET